MTAAAPTYLPNDRAFGTTNEKNAKRLCDTCLLVFVYIYIYKHRETSRFLPTALPSMVDLDWFVGRLFSRLSRSVVVRRGGGHDRTAG